MEKIQVNNIIYVKQDLQDISQDTLLKGFYKVHRILQRDFPNMITYWLLPANIESTDTQEIKKHIITYVFSPKVLEQNSDICSSYEVLYKEIK